LSVRRKFFDEICSDKKDTLFFMGTVFPYNTWVVLGCFLAAKTIRARHHSRNTVLDSALMCQEFGRNCARHGVFQKRSPIQVGIGQEPPVHIARVSVSRNSGFYPSQRVFLDYEGRPQRDIPERYQNIAARGESSEIASLTVCIEINQFIPKIQRSFSILILGAKLFQAVSPLRQPGLGQSQFRRRYP
jgi:hypothetical protein